MLSPHVPSRQAAPQKAPLRPPFPSTASQSRHLDLPAPGSAQRHCQDLLNVKSRALWCHPAAIWGAQRLSNYTEQSLAAFNYPSITHEAGVLTFRHPVLTLSMPNLHPAPDKSGPSQKFLGSFVYSMLGTGVTGCLCISVIGTLFPLEECKLPKCTGLRSVQDGTSPFSQSP